jgi:hypothetical protein
VKSVHAFFHQEDATPAALVVVHGARLERRRRRAATLVDKLELEDLVRFSKTDQNRLVR